MSDEAFKRVNPRVADAAVDAEAVPFDGIAMETNEKHVDPVALQSISHPQSTPF